MCIRVIEVSAVDLSSVGTMGNPMPNAWFCTHDGVVGLWVGCSVGMLYYQV